MAENIKDFALAFILTGVIIFGLLTFAIVFVFNNNQSALGETDEQVNILTNNLSNSLTELEVNMDTQTNISAQLNSEEGGEDSSAANSYGFQTETQSQWTIMKTMIAWVFAGTFGQIVIKILSGIIGLVGLYYIIKLITSLF